ncbi:hypothetical protein ACG98G_04965 [Megasphaera hexanoica]|uniref:Uncharacterized protein n=1 Tax=Megasphaera hexanoica TaxID=1675036 RepID=A0ABW7DP63_9FIRM|nr:hypothetical protein [Megasphaera hexanoica]
MEAYKEEQLLALLDAKKDGAGHCNIVNMAWNLLRADKGRNK